MLLTPALEAFIEVAHAGTVHGAAQKLRLTQAAVTSRIKGLEDSLSASLFLRSRRGMTLTDAGHHLLQHCLRIRASEGELLSMVRGVPDEQEVRVRIQGTSSIMRARVIPALSMLKASPSMRSAATKVVYTFIIDDNLNGIEALKQGACDFALVRDTQVPNECDSKRLKPERYVLCVPVAWAKRSAEDIVSEERIIDFDPMDDFTFAWLERARLKQQARPERVFANNTDAMCSLTELGMGYCVVSEEFARPLAAQKRIAILDPHRAYEVKRALAWFSRAYMPEPMREVVRALA